MNWRTILNLVLIGWAGAQSPGSVSRFSHSGQWMLSRAGEMIWTNFGTLSPDLGRSTEHLVFLVLPLAFYVDPLARGRDADITLDVGKKPHCF
jgi:hypothetical protein